MVSYLLIVNGCAIGWLAALLAWWDSGKVTRYTWIIPGMIYTTVRIVEEQSNNLTSLMRCFGPRERERENEKESQA